MKASHGILLTALGASCRTLPPRSAPERVALSPAARCYEYAPRNRDLEDWWRWLVLDTVTVDAPQAGERDARRLALQLAAFNHWPPDRRTEWVRTTDDSIQVLMWGTVPGYTLAETPEGLAGWGWLFGDVSMIVDGKLKPTVTYWPAQLRRTPCTELPTFSEAPKGPR